MGGGPWCEKQQREGLLLLPYIQKIKSPEDKRDNKQIRNNTLWFILNSNKHQA